MPLVVAATVLAMDFSSSCFCPISFACSSKIYDSFYSIEASSGKIAPFCSPGPCILALILLRFSLQFSSFCMNIALLLTVLSC